jgi:hypothetical protein
MEAIRLRASSLPELFDCPQRWAAKNLFGMRLPSSGNAVLGTAVHAGTAAFDMAKLEGSPISADDAAGAVVDAIHAPADDVQWDEDLKQQDAEKIGIALHTLYCQNIAPQQAYIAVEAECESLEIEELGIRLTGTTDRVFKSDVGYGIADIKTGKSAVGADGTVKTAGHAAQIAVYELLAEAALARRMEAPAQIIGLQVAKTDKGRRAAIGIVDDARSILVGTEDSPGLLEHASRMIKSGDFYGNARSQLCNPKYCPMHAQCTWRR